MSHEAPSLFPVHSQMWTQEPTLAGLIRSFQVFQFQAKVSKPVSEFKVQILYCRLWNACMYVYVVMAGIVICPPLFFTHTHTPIARNECIISTNPLRTPCVNGWCIDGVNSYYCTCNQDFQGLNCDEPGIFFFFSQCVHAIFYNSKTDSGTQCMHAYTHYIDTHTIWILMM